MDADKQKRFKGLIPYKPGQSGNPAGRPPRIKCIPDLLRWAGDLKCPEGTTESLRKIFGITGDLTVEQALILRSMAAGLRGDIRHLEFWAERTEGKPDQSMTIKNDGPIVALIQNPVLPAGRPQDTP